MGQKKGSKRSTSNESTVPGHFMESVKNVAPHQVHPVFFGIAAIDQEIRDDSGLAGTSMSKWTKRTTNLSCLSKHLPSGNLLHI